MQVLTRLRSGVCVVAWVPELSISTKIFELHWKYSYHRAGLRNTIIARRLPVELLLLLFVPQLCTLLRVPQLLQPIAFCSSSLDLVWAAAGRPLPNLKTQPSAAQHAEAQGDAHKQRSRGVARSMSKT